MHTYIASTQNYNVCYTINYKGTNPHVYYVHKIALLYTILYSFVDSTMPKIFCYNLIVLP